MNLPAQLFVLCALAGASLAEDSVVYDMAEGMLGKGSPWSGEDAQLRLSPGSAGTLKFELGDLPTHAFLKLDVQVAIASPFLRFDEPGPESEERLQIAIAGGRKLFDCSFSTGEEGQSFPDRFGSFVHPPNTGSQDDDNRYRFQLVFPHTEDDLSLSFRWKKPGAANAVNIGIQINGLNLGGGDGSAYTVTDLKVTALEAATEGLEAERAEELLATLSGKKPAAANRALNQLIIAGADSLPFIRERFAEEPDADLTAKIATLAEGLRSESFKDRTAAQKALGQLGPEAIGPIIAFLADNADLTADVRNGLKEVKTRIEKKSAAAPEQVLANRVRPALELLDTDEARAVLEMLPAEKKIARYTAPKDEDDIDIKIDGGFKFEFNLGGDDDDE